MIQMYYLETHMEVGKSCCQDILSINNSQAYIYVQSVKIKESRQWF